MTAALAVGATVLLGATGQAAVRPFLRGPEMESYRVDDWMTEQGLPQNTVKAILQTRDGYLWMGTPFGLTRFDGTSFKTFDRSSTPPLAEENCEDLVEDVHGGLWMLGARYATLYFNRQWTSIALMPDTPDARAWAASRSREGGIWVASDAGLLRVNKGRVQRLGVADGLPGGLVSGVCEDLDTGCVWALASQGVYQRARGAALFVLIQSVDQVLGPERRQFLLDAQRFIWVGTTRGIWRWRPGAAPSLLTTANGLSHNEAAFIAEDSSRRVWVGTMDRGLHRFENGRFVLYDWRSFFAGDTLLCFCGDREGDLWLGLNYGGLTRLQRRYMGALTSEDGLLDDDVISICEGRDGALWFGMKGGVSRYRDGRCESFGLPPGPDTDSALSVLEDSAGQLWVGTRDSGLRRLAAGRLVQVPLSGNTEADRVYALYEDRQQNLWVGTRRGVYRAGQDELRCFTTGDGLPHNAVRGILQDRRGDMWFATYGGGVAHLQENTFTVISEKEGLSDRTVWVLREDSRGAIWVGTELGLSRLQNGHAFAFSTKHGLFDEEVNDLLEDLSGHLWIGCNRGIFRVSRAELEAVAAGRQSLVRSAVYGVADGMLSSETNGETQPAACATRDGLFWFPTVKGAVYFDPRNLRQNPLPPPVVIDEVIANQESVLTGSPAVIPPGKGRVVEFHYSGNSLMAPERVLYRYRLEGCDPDWIEAGPRRVAYYTNLRPGAYRFRVKACNNHGVWNETGAWFDLRLRPFFYQTWAFKAACIVAIMLLAWLGYWLRVRFLGRLHELERQHALDLERARIARDMHDAIGAGLTKISYVADRARKSLEQQAEPQEYITKIAVTASTLFRSLDELVWAVNPRHDRVESLVAYLGKYAEDYVRSAGIAYRQDLPFEELNLPISGQERHTLLYAFKEAVHNAVRHAHASEVWVRVQASACMLLLSVEDNGHGIADLQAHAHRHGLAGMRERLDKIGGALSIETGPGCGTKVHFRLPLKTSLSPAKAQPSKSVD